MKSVVSSRRDGSSGMRLEERPIAEPQSGEIRVRVVVSGVNPTDWKERGKSDWRAYRQGSGQPPVEDEDVVPNQDGAGIVDAVGPGVTGFAPGDRVWLTLAGYERPASGTAQELTVVPARRAFHLPECASFDLGASIGIPAVTAHRALTVGEEGPRRLSRGALAGQTVLVAGGAGGVGNAAIQLARWAGAEVVATVSSDAKALLASTAGADHTIDYRSEDAAARIRDFAPDGIDTVVDVAVGANSALDLAVLKPRGTISIYAGDGGRTLTLDIMENNVLNARYQFILLYTLGWDLIEAAGEDVNEAIADGAFSVGEWAGIVLRHFDLEETLAAHDAVEGGAVGRALVRVDPSTAAEPGPPQPA